MSRDLNAATRGVIEHAIASLVNIGWQREAALSLLAFQSAVRLESQQRLAGLAVDIINLVDDRARLGEIAAAVMGRTEQMSCTVEPGHA